MAARPLTRWWPPVFTGLASVALTLGVALWLDIEAAARRVEPEPEAPEPVTVSVGDAAPAGVDVVFPFERYSPAADPTRSWPIALTRTRLIPG